METAVAFVLCGVADEQARKRASGQFVRSGRAKIGVAATAIDMRCA
jgi:hypothetical protein